MTCKLPWRAPIANFEAGNFDAQRGKIQVIRAKTADIQPADFPVPVPLVDLCAESTITQLLQPSLRTPQLAKTSQGNRILVISRGYDVEIGDTVGPQGVGNHFRRRPIFGAAIFTQ